MAISAKYAGVCKATGRSYRAGTMIEKGPHGWQIAETHSAGSETVVVRTPGGAIKTIHIGPTMYHAECIKGAGIDTSTCKPGDANIEFARYDRTGDDFTCRNCTGVMHVLTPDETYTESVLPTLRIVNAGGGMMRLSHKVPAAQWDTVKQYFTYWTEDDLDQQDIFDTPGGYYLIPGYAEPDEILNRAPGADFSTIVKVEELLGILPENRYVVRQAQAKIEEQAKIEREAAKKQARIDEIAAKEAHRAAIAAERKPLIAGLVEASINIPEDVAFQPGPAEMEIGTVDGQTIYRTAVWAASHVFAPQAVLDRWVQIIWASRVATDGEASTARNLIEQNEFYSNCSGAYFSVRMVQLLGLQKLVEMAKQSEWLISPYNLGDRVAKLAERHGIPHCLLASTQHSGYVCQAYSRLLGSDGKVGNDLNVEHVWQRPDGRKVVQFYSREMRPVDDIDDADVARVATAIEGEYKARERAWAEKSKEEAN